MGGARLEAEASFSDIVEGRYARRHRQDLADVLVFAAGVYCGESALLQDTARAIRARLAH